jgi:3D (Asp-Asp-Asp) domain-containing protein
MLNRRWKANRRHLRLLRIVAIALGFGFAIHVAHRECSIMANGTLSQKSLYPVSTTSQSISSAEDFEATAYCVTGITKSGIKVAPGHVAADPKVIPLGSMIYVDSPLMGGVYQVLDTGELVKGKIIDIFIPSHDNCVEFGRRAVKVQVLRYGFLGKAPSSRTPR